MLLPGTDLLPRVFFNEAQYPCSDFGLFALEQSGLTMLRGQAAGGLRQSPACIRQLGNRMSMPALRLRASEWLVITEIERHSST